MSAAPLLQFPLSVPERQVWRADQIGSTLGRTQSTGYPRLDRELPDGGWPASALIELLPEQEGIGEMRLLLPVLRNLPRSRKIALVRPPHAPHVAAWAGWNFLPDQLLWVRTQDDTDALWAAEQILRNGSCAALLLWQNEVRAEKLRRLHLGAQENDLLCWLLRPAQAAIEPSPAQLRLSLHPAAAGLEVGFLKRRGPPRDQRLFIPLAYPPARPVHPFGIAHDANLDRHPPSLVAARSPAAIPG